MESPKVSVIIPFFNSEAYVDEVLESVRGQSLRDVEIICVDDGSTDITLRALNENAGKDPRIKVLSQEHKGAGTARNKGLTEARGKYVMFLDSDDSYKNNFVEEMYNAAEKHGVDIALCWFCQVDSWGSKTIHKLGFDSGRLKPNHPVHPSEIHNLFITVAPYPHNKIWRRDWVVSQGLFFSDTQAYNDTFFCYASVAAARKIVAIDKELYTYRYHHNDSSISSNRDKYTLDFLKVDKGLYNWLKEKGMLKMHTKSYCNLWRRHMHGAAGNSREWNIVPPVVKTLIEEEPWSYMTDKELQREAGLQTDVARLRLRVLGKKIQKNGKDISNANKIVIQNSNREIEVVQEIISQLRTEGRNVRYKAGKLHTGIWMLREKGVHGFLPAAYRMVYRRFSKGV